MMQRNFLAIVPLMTMLAACGGTEECNAPRIYQEAVPGKRVEVPEGLDSLAAGRELTIPEASPQAPPPPGSCLDAPPTLSTERTRN
jgi:uncharacterized lipoprotein